ncbi:MAG: hypothetical protein WDW20_06390 [Neisseriaceae bacterium]
MVLGLLKELVNGLLKGLVLEGLVDKELNGLLEGPVRGLADHESKGLLEGAKLELLKGALLGLLEGAVNGFEEGFDNGAIEGLLDNRAEEDKARLSKELPNKELGKPEELGPIEEEFTDRLKPSSEEVNGSEELLLKGRLELKAPELNPVSNEGSPREGNKLGNGSEEDESEPKLKVDKLEISGMALEINPGAAESSEGKEE